jgi:hypothetical protein
MLTQASLETLRISDAEDYHVLKIRLETDIQVPLTDKAWAGGQGRRRGRNLQQLDVLILGT